MTSEELAKDLKNLKITIPDDFDGDIGSWMLGYKACLDDLQAIFARKLDKSLVNGSNS